MQMGTDDLFEHDIDVVMGIKFVVEMSFVQRRLTGSWTWIEPEEPIVLRGITVRSMSDVLFTMFGLNVI